MRIPDFKELKVLVVGDVMLDRYFRGNATRISPEAPIPVVHVKSREDRPGGAANVALNLKALGATVTLMGMVGADAEGEILSTLLETKGVNCLFQKTKVAPTVTKLRVIGQHQQLLRVDFEEEPLSFSIEKQRDVFKEQLKKADVVILSDYLKGTLSDSQALIALAKAENVPVFIDPKQPSFASYAGASVLTPNMKEFTAVVGKVDTVDEMLAKGKEQLMQHDIDAILLTRSEKGMLLIHKDLAPIEMPVKAQEVFDVTGAGDTVIATLACAIAAGEKWERAMALANAAAGVAIGKLGAATVSPAELQQAYNSQTRVSNLLVDEDQLKLLVEQAKAKGKAVVMTNGCFDLLHPGHMAYLAEAKALGDYLIVAVNDDDSVKRLKGASRPVNSLENRMIMLASLKFVDWVIPFSEDTPEALICNILPNILVKGGDYKPEEIAGSQCVTASGGEVKVLCFEQGLSSSALIKKIKEV